MCVEGGVELEKQGIKRTEKQGTGEAIGNFHCLNVAD